MLIDVISMKNRKIFNWQYEWVSGDGWNREYSIRKDTIEIHNRYTYDKLTNIHCNFCLNKLSEPSILSTEKRLYCKACGYSYFYSSWMSMSGSEYDKSYRTILKQFDPKLSEKSLSELIKWLGAKKENYGYIYNINPRIIEFAIADIYANQGYKIVMTKATRDGGYDFYILSNGKDQVIVEVKNMKNKVSVKELRALYGVQLVNKFTGSKFITTGYFSEPAKKFNSKAKENGFDMDLVEAEELLIMIKSYNNSGNLIDDVNYLKEYQNI